MKPYAVEAKHNLSKAAKFRCIEQPKKFTPDTNSFGEAANALMQRVVHFDGLSLADRIVFVAESQLGVTEHPPNSNWGPEVKQYLAAAGITTRSIYNYWCAAFDTWCVIHAGYTGKLPGNPASCTEWMNWAKPRHLWVKPQDVKPGDLLQFNLDTDSALEHTGICVAVVRDSHGKITAVIAIEGNTSSDDNGSQDNGGGVYKKTRSIALVVGAVRLKG